MPQIRLTEKGIKSLAGEDGERAEYWDILLPNFGLRVSVGGKKSFVAMYRFHGRKRRVTIGRYPAMSLAEARDAAREVFKKADGGQDPAGDKRREGVPVTFGDLATEYIDRHAKTNKRSWREDERQIQKDLAPAWKKRKLASIERADVIRILDMIEARGAPVGANRMLALINKIFNWAVGKAIMRYNPAAGIPKVKKEKSRTRVLSDDEVKAIWKATDKIGKNWGDCVKLMLLTLQRHGEVTGIRQDDVDLANKMWVIQPDLMKNDKPHNVPLSAAAAAILEDRRDNGSDYFFPSQGKGRGKSPMSGLSNLKRSIDEISGVTGWVFHDFRRTGTSYLAKMNVDPHIADRVLSHTGQIIKGVAAVYNRYQYDDEKRHALDLWAQHLDDVINDRCPKVVVLKARD